MSAAEHAKLRECIAVRIISDGFAPPTRVHPANCKANAACACANIVLQLDAALRYRAASSARRSTAIRRAISTQNTIVITGPVRIAPVINAVPISSPATAA